MTSKSGDGWRVWVDEGTATDWTEMAVTQLVVTGTMIVVVVIVAVVVVIVAVVVVV